MKKLRNLKADGVKHINFLQIFRLFSKPSTVCVDKALDEKFTNTAEIKN